MLSFIVPVVITVRLCCWHWWLGDSKHISPVQNLKPASKKYSS